MKNRKKWGFLYEKMGVFIGEMRFLLDNQRFLYAYVKVNGLLKLKRPHFHSKKHHFPSKNTIFLSKTPIFIVKNARVPVKPAG
jgi:hypothetical protein